MLLFAEYASEVSSANILDNENKFSDISLIKIKNKKGPSTDPCGTPAFKHPVFELVSFITTI